MDPQKHHTKEDLKKLAPTLFNLDKQNVYKTPEGFFNKLQSSIEKQCLKEKRRITLERVISFARYLSAAAAVVGFILTSFYFLNKGSATNAYQEKISELKDQQGIKKFYTIIDNDRDGD